MLLRELRCGDWFTFDGRPEFPYQYMGNGWYGKAYSGGPWHTRENPRVFLCDLEHTDNLNRWHREITNAT